MTISKSDPLADWERHAAWGRTVACTAETACGKLADPGDTVPCDFEAGHPTTEYSGRSLLSGGCNSYGDEPVGFDKITRARRHHEGTSPLSQPPGTTLAACRSTPSP